MLRSIVQSPIACRGPRLAPSRGTRVRLSRRPPPASVFTWTTPFNEEDFREAGARPPCSTENEREQVLLQRAFARCDVAAAGTVCFWPVPPRRTAVPRHLWRSYTGTAGRQRITIGPSGLRTFGSAQGPQARQLAPSGWAAPARSVCAAGEPAPPVHRAVPPRAPPPSTTLPFGGELMHLHGGSGGRAAVGYLAWRGGRGGDGASSSGDAYYVAPSRSPGSFPEWKHPFFVPGVSAAMAAHPRVIN